MHWNWKNNTWLKKEIWLCRSGLGTKTNFYHFSVAGQYGKLTSNDCHLLQKTTKEAQKNNINNINVITQKIIMDICYTAHWFLCCHLGNTTKESLYAPSVSFPLTHHRTDTFHADLCIAASTYLLHSVCIMHIVYHMLDVYTIYHWHLYIYIVGF